MIRTNASLSLIQKEVYDAQQAVLPDASEEDVQLVNNPDGSNEPDTSNSQKDTGAPNSPQKWCTQLPKKEESTWTPEKASRSRRSSKNKES